MTIGMATRNTHNVVSTRAAPDSTVARMRTSRVLIAVCAFAGLALVSGRADAQRGAHHQPRWRLSANRLPVQNLRMIGLKLDAHRAIWFGGGGDTSTPANTRRAFIYDTRNRRFHEVASIPAAKNTSDVSGQRYTMLSLAAAGVLADRSVVVTGGQISQTDPEVNANNVLSYRYYPDRDRWVRTGDLPEPQDFSWTPTNLLRDGRLIATAGRGPGAITSGVASAHAFVYNPRKRTVVNGIDPDTGRRTGHRDVVVGAWDYTRTADGHRSAMSEGHYYGNSVLLRDGRVLVLGGHTLWKLDSDDASRLATHTDFFNPRTGTWTQGAPLPTVPARTTGSRTRMAGARTACASRSCATTRSSSRAEPARPTARATGRPSSAGAASWS